MRNMLKRPYLYKISDSKHMHRMFNRPKHKDLRQDRLKFEHLKPKSLNFKLPTLNSRRHGHKPRLGRSRRKLWSNYQPNVPKTVYLDLYMMM